MRRKYCIFWAVMACVLTIAGYAWGDVAIDEANFPDNVVRDTVRGFDTDNNGVLNAAEIAEAKEVHIGGRSVYNLKGIEYLTALEVLHCEDNHLSTVDVSSNRALVDLSCWNNGMTSLNISGCTSLDHLNCTNNQLTSINVSGNTSLRFLYLDDNPLTSLNVTGCTSLKSLNCGNTQLTSINASTCPSLMELNCWGNSQLTSINVAGCTSLMYLNCGGAQLTALDVSTCSALAELECNDNPLATLNISGCTKLIRLNCWNNNLTALDASTCTSLMDLECNDNNQLATLNVSGCTKLITLRCWNTKLTTLDVSTCTSLMELTCNDNQLTTLNVSGCTNLTNLGCWNNQITALDVSKCTALKDLNCGGNQIRTLNLSKCTALTNLECGGNQIQTLDLSKCRALETLNCAGNQLNTLDLSKCTALTDLDCSGSGLNKLNISGCAALRNLDCRWNQLTTLNVSNANDLVTLRCDGNQLSKLNVSNKTALKFLSCCHNNMKTLNVSGCTSLMGLICWANELTTLDVSTCHENITVAADPELNVVKTMEITTSSLPDTTRRATYSTKLAALGGATPYTWSVSNGSLPDGLTLKASSGKITGTATKAGTFTFTVQLKDNTGRTATKDFTLKVTQTTVSGTIPATTTRRDSYTGTPQASGGKSPYTWSVSSGKLPDGLKLNSSNGKITGSPTKAGTFTFTIKAKDANGAAGTKAYTIKVTQTKVSGTIPATITRKASCSWTPKASNGASPYTWSVSSGKLPDGLTLNASTGAITGSPTKAGTFTFTLKAKDSNGAAGTKAYTVTVTQTTVTGTIPATGTVGSSFTFSPKASGGEAPYTWSVSSGKIPNGLTLNTSTGKITGTFTKSGTFTFTLKAKDSNGAAGTKNYTVKVTATSSAKPLQPDTSGDMPAELTAGLPQVQDIPGVPGGIPETDGTGKAVLPASLGVKSDDVLGSGEGQESDLITVKAGKTLTFILGKWSVEVSGVTVWIDDKPAEGITISDDGTFTLKAELVTGDFKVCVKATHNGSELESGTLYIIAE
ncbi:MAG: leucine-rich repeat domain-containing protein [Synergistaceae bacterium]|nr:leucine-rich repeat domain-containing protein [Synergistaceae bacterium]